MVQDAKTVDPSKLTALTPEVVSTFTIYNHIIYTTCLVCVFGHECSGVRFVAASCCNCHRCRTALPAHHCHRPRPQSSVVVVVDD